MRYANIYIYIFVLHRGFFQQPRPRVGICLSRLDALTSKYNTFSYCQVGASTPNLAMSTRGRVAPRWGHAPQVRTFPQHTYIYTRGIIPFMFFNTKHKKIVLIICSFKAESVLLPCYSFPAKKVWKKFHSLSRWFTTSYAFRGEISQKFLPKTFGS